MGLDDRELKRLKELVPYKVLAPTPDEICEEIERLTKQNKALNEMYELTKKEYIRLNNIINELEKYLNEQVDYMTHHSIERMVAFDCCRHKLQELKGSDKD